MSGSCRVRGLGQTLTPLPYGELYIILLAQKRKKRVIYYQNKKVKLRKYARKVDALFPIIHY